MLPAALHQPQQVFAVRSTPPQNVRNPVAVEIPLCHLSGRRSFIPKNSSAVRRGDQRVFVVPEEFVDRDIRRPPVGSRPAFSAVFAAEDADFRSHIEMIGVSGIAHNGAHGRFGKRTSYVDPAFSSIGRFLEVVPAVSSPSDVKNLRIVFVDHQAQNHFSVGSVDLDPEWILRGSIERFVDFSLVVAHENDAGVTLRDGNLADLAVPIRSGRLFDL